MKECIDEREVEMQVLTWKLMEVVEDYTLDPSQLPPGITNDMYEVVCMDFIHRVVNG